MFWPLGGVLLWLGGWWFTGRLFGVYRKAIYFESIDRRHRGLPPSPEQHHTGAALFLVFDLGLLLLGIRSLVILQHGGEAIPLGDAPEWSVLLCIYLFREGIHLHHFYHDRWRARSGREALEPHQVGTLRGLWGETPVSLRWMLVIGPLLALMPIVAMVVGREESGVLFPSDRAVALILWVFVPATLIVIALSTPLWRLRKLLREHR